MAKEMPSAMGATFAERAAAAKGNKTFKDPREDAPEAVENSTFGSRGKPSRKAVQSAENKAVKSSARKG